jgi:hypothetical protein
MKALSRPGAGQLRLNQSWEIEFRPLPPGFSEKDKKRKYPKGLYSRIIFNHSKK